MDQKTVFLLVVTLKNMLKFKLSNTLIFDFDPYPSIRRQFFNNLEARLEWIISASAEPPRYTISSSVMLQWQDISIGPAIAGCRAKAPLHTGWRHRSTIASTC